MLYRAHGRCGGLQLARGVSGLWAGQLSMSLMHPQLAMAPSGQLRDLMAP